MAFESLATDMTPGVRAGISNVYAVFRRGPWKQNGSPWRPGETVLISRGLGGRPADGSSYDPQLSGDSRDPPRCIAFLSRASNLVIGDHNHVADAFVASLVTHRITRVSVNSYGQEANGTTSSVAVSGDCTRVAFVSDATNLTSGGGATRWPGSGTSAPRPGSRQVYLHFLPGPTAADRALAGLTMLTSATAGHAANADAYEPSIASYGHALVFVSAATNLGAPSVGIPQVWERRITAVRVGRGKTGLRVTTRLVSATPLGTGGNGPSTRPSVDHDGGAIAFETTASDLVSNPIDGVSQIVLATLNSGSPRLEWVSKSRQSPLPFPGPSYDASITEGGEWVFFDNGLNSSTESVGRREVYRWTSAALAAPYDKGGVLVKSVGDVALPSRTPAENAATSARGNYMPFESEDPLLDPRVVQRRHEPLWYRHTLSRFQILSLPDAPVLMARPDELLPLLQGVYGTPPSDRSSTAPLDPRLHQVYVRYLGPQ